MVVDFFPTRSWRNQLSTSKLKNQLGLGLGWGLGHKTVKNAYLRKIQNFGMVGVFFPTGSQKNQVSTSKLKNQLS